MRRGRRHWASRMLPLLIILGVMAFTLRWPFERPQSTITGRARIVDCDTIDIRGERIRILDIDAPERDQPCTRGDGVAVHCGHLASGALLQLIGGHLQVEFRPDEVAEPAGQQRWATIFGDCLKVALGA